VLIGASNGGLSRNLLVNRLILLSFLVMGWGYYELSGGSDFEPERRVAIAEPAPEALPATAPAEDAVLVAAAVAEPPPETAEVTRTDTRALETLPEPASPAEQAITLEASSVAEALARALEDEASAVTIGIAAPETAPVPDAPQADLVAAAPAPLAGDLRTVTGDTVNLRDGPGTNFNVLERLTRGTVISLLETGPEGWAYIEVGGRTGWMSADFLGPAT
jgi:hypothetical protein